MSKQVVYCKECGYPVDMGGLELPIVIESHADPRICVANLRSQVVALEGRAALQLNEQEALTLVACLATFLKGLRPLYGPGPEALFALLGARVGSQIFLTALNMPEALRVQLLQSWLNKAKGSVEVHLAQGQTADISSIGNTQVSEGKEEASGGTASENEPTAAQESSPESKAGPRSIRGPIQLNRAARRAARRNGKARQ